MAQIIRVAPPRFGKKTIYFLRLDGEEESAYIPGRAHAGYCPEVRSAVANTDEPGALVYLLCSAWVVGLILAVLISGVNRFFLIHLHHVMYRVTGDKIALLGA